jgi:hypothetical protein
MKAEKISKENVYIDLLNIQEEIERKASRAEAMDFWWTNEKRVCYMIEADTKGFCKVVGNKKIYYLNLTSITYPNLLNLSKKEKE